MPDMSADPRTIPAGASATGIRGAVLALVVSSGAIALVYECLWVREFTALFGATAPSAASTVAATFAGLALGNAWFGARAPRRRRPLSVYALLEAGAGACALITLAASDVFQRLAPWIDARLAHAPGWLPVTRAVEVFAAVLPPTFLLGGTLPLLTHACDEQRGAGGIAGSRLYAANTGGAVIGALGVPFVLLPWLGAHRAYLGAVAASLAVGAVAWSLDRSRKTRPLQSSAAALSQSRDEPSEGRRLLLGLAFASGITALGLEVIWGRMLSQVHHNSVHAFATVLALFLAALALGATFATSLLARGVDRSRLLGRAWLAAGFFTLAAPAVFARVTGGLDSLSSPSWSSYLASLLGASAASFGPATVSAGMVLPVLLARSARARGPASPEVGRVLAANTLGAVAGPLLTTFVLFPWLGTWGSVVIHGVAQLGLGLRVGNRGRGRHPRWKIAVPAAAAAVLLARHALRLPRVRWESERGEELVWIREGSHGIASVIEHPGGRRLKLDNFYTLGGSGAIEDSRQLGHIPLLLHVAPRRVAVVGLGTGITASAVLVHDVEEVVIFELVPEVVAAARERFSTENRSLLDDPRVELQVGDAQSHLRATDRRYDVIVGDLVVPWRRGESSLHTREHFASVRRALAPGGLYCQWLPAFQMSQEQFRIVAATFLDVFPEVTLWRGDFVAGLPALALIGRESEQPFDPHAIDARFRALGPMLAEENRCMAHPAGLWLYVVGELDASLPWVGSTPRNTRDMPWLELSSARSQLAPGSGGRALFLGEPLLRFLEEVRLAPTTAALARLEETHRAWRDKGAELFRASCMAEAG